MTVQMVVLKDPAELTVRRGAQTESLSLVLSMRQVELLNAQ